jgi:hypothetical protein
MSIFRAFLWTCAAAAAAAPAAAQTLTPENAVGDARAAALAARRVPALDCDYTLRWGNDGMMLGSALSPLRLPAPGEPAATAVLETLEGKRLTLAASLGADARLDVRLAWRRISDGRTLGQDERVFAPKRLDGLRFKRTFDSSEPAEVLARNPRTPPGTLPISRVEVRCAVDAPQE